MSHAPQVIRLLGHVLGRKRRSERLDVCRIARASRYTLISYLLVKANSCSIL